METSLLPLARSRWIFQLIASSVALSVSLILAAAALSGIANPLYLALAIVSALMFGTVFVGCVRTLATSGLTLSDAGFRYAGRFYPRSDIAGFTPVGMFGKSHVRILFVPGATLDWEEKLAETTAKIGFYHPASHIPIKGFETGGVPLEKVLTDWRRRA
ncbi:hypothetical protein JDV09_03385 [Mycobacterium sp. Y57]|uniref:hypothetical protein n=1 Tax=Mycolicibacterium xanthum TaxID=2796469 RepID=UPI001C853709|nr:hypothetical protein [Mycolicibacterium xanthum]MBX7431156.1 hypothetical protein [Mycolicibacterium xanthum]